MAYSHMPRPQQRGSQLSGAPKEAVADRSAQKNDEADQQVAGEPARGIDYPADALENRHGDITPTPRERETQRWDDVVQPEPARDADDSEPLPEGQ